jgi:hypothetical protein
MAQTRCAICGRMGVVGACEHCHKQVCAECSAPMGGGAVHGPLVICAECRHQDRPEAAAEHSPGRGWHPLTAGAVAEQAPVELAAEAAAGYGFWDSISRAFTFLRETLAMAFADKDLILPALFATIANVVVIGGVMLILWRSDALHELGQEHAGLLPLAVLACVGLPIHILGYFFTGMIVHLVDAHLRGRDARLDEAFADARKNFLALLGLAVVSTLVGIATSMLRGRRGRSLGDYAADAIDRVWIVATYLILPAIILEDLPLRAAANRARDLHQRNLLGIAVGEVGVVVLTRIIAFVGMLIAFGVGFGAYMLAGGGVAATAAAPPVNLPRPPVFVTGAPVVVGAVVAGVILSLVMSFTTYVRTAYYTCLFLWAVATEEQGERVAAPAPLASTLARGTA